ncbi:hypothetical protein [Aphanothece sacrum]|uniref:Addiction module antitoxin n=1 Tax=Aphanothece sacrum FPU1 TaxID=1920663 RepID=A0A401IEC2_APHSA|nr:hypothetical protein [Aphanothece sacrum]GBF79625.1 addiction module antitoxin [Aphanothece sacrum FPU1]GBF87085.1 addiction module antitoxin [Aphanothece sacrum FPU3]
MSEEIPDLKIFFFDDFKSRLRTLAKRYRSIRNDLQLILIYAKSDQTDITTNHIRDIINKFYILSSTELRM